MCIYMYIYIGMYEVMYSMWADGNRFSGYPPQTESTHFLINIITFLSCTIMLCLIPFLYVVCVCVCVCVCVWVGGWVGVGVGVCVELYCVVCGVYCSGWKQRGCFRRQQISWTTTGKS